jgi:hypothetical protein
MGGNRWVDQLTPQGIQARESTRLIEAHEARVTDHVGRQDRRKPPLKALLSHVDHSPGNPTAATLWFTGHGVYRGRHVGDGSIASFERRARRVRYCSDRYQNGVTQYL